MTPIISLIFIPFVLALICLICTGKLRSFFVCFSCAVISITSICSFVYFYCLRACDSAILVNFNSWMFDYICFIVNIVLMIVVLVFCVKYKKIIPACLAIIQVCFEVFLELSEEKASVNVTYGFSVDMLTLVMVLIIGIVGSGICIYAIGYMNDFQKHVPKDSSDKRSFFFAVCILFLGAMFLIVFSNNMCWMLCGWEITTVCSFLLIGYTKTDEAINNSFLQITLNLIGGIAFSVGIFFSIKFTGSIEFNTFIKNGLSSPTYAMIPLVLFSIAAFTKAAQVPFHSWLLGAMVAPTPTSALLHSSTMVKAGVFLLIKLSPLFAVCEFVGTTTSLIGGLTFIFASIVAISQSNAKRVLAYSTIANLGLVTMCAGIGNEIAIFAAVMLVIFHAIAKSMLFLCVGCAEHHIGSRDIESFDLLFNKMPKLSRFMMFGILSMFVAPFGMLIAKWAAIISVVDAKNITLLIFMCFGSAATFAYWAKWLGKLAGIAQNCESIEKSVSKTENFSFYLMATLLALANVCLPFIAIFACDKTISCLFGTTTSVTNLLSQNSLLICAILSFVIFYFLFDVVGKPAKKRERELTPYLSGITQDSNKRTFSGSIEDCVEATTRNFYLSSYFGESVTPIVSLFGVALIAIALIYSIAMYVV